MVAPSGVTIIGSREPILQQTPADTLGGSRRVPALVASSRPFDLMAARVRVGRHGEVLLEDSSGRWWLVREEDDALRFATYGQTRRLEGVPTAWQHLSPDELEALLIAATPLR